MRTSQPNAVRTVAVASTHSIRDGVEHAAADERASETAAYLLTLTDEDFRELVEKDARGRLPVDVGDVFGHPLVCNRWHAAIKALQVREAQARSKNPWLVVALADRRSRAVHAIEAAKSVPGSHPSVKPNATPRARAIDRLIAAHEAEFVALIAEEETNV